MTSIKQNISIIVIGTSAGGIPLLLNIFSTLPTSFHIPIILVQHISKANSTGYIPILEQSSQLPIIEAYDKMPITPGHIFVAPPEYHILVEENKSLSIGLFDPVCYSRPSVDVLFESAAEVYQHECLGIILSGANADGAKGLKHIAKYKGTCIIQDPNEAEFSRMPKSAMKESKVAQILTLNNIIRVLLNLK